MELVNEDAEKYRPNSITTPADYLNVRPFQLAMCVRPDDSLAASTGYHVHHCDVYDLTPPDRPAARVCPQAAAPDKSYELTVRAERADAGERAGSHSRYRPRRLT